MLVTITWRRVTAITVVVSKRTTASQVVLDTLEMEQMIKGFQKVLKVANTQKKAVGQPRVLSESTLTPPP